jgi:hypothetical protein
VVALGFVACAASGERLIAQNSGHDWHRGRRRIDGSGRLASLCQPHRTGSAAAQRQGRFQRRVGPPLRAGHERLERRNPSLQKGPGHCPTRGRSREHQVVRTLRRTATTPECACRLDSCGRLNAPYPFRSCRTTSTSPSSSNRATGSTSSLQEQHSRIRTRHGSASRLRSGRG